MGSNVNGNKINYIYFKADQLLKDIQQTKVIVDLMLKQSDEWLGLQCITHPYYLRQLVNIICYVTPSIAASYFVGSGSPE